MIQVLKVRSTAHSWRRIIHDFLGVYTIPVTIASLFKSSVTRRIRFLKTHIVKCQPEVTATNSHSFNPWIIKKKNFLKF